MYNNYNVVYISWKWCTGHVLIMTFLMNGNCRFGTVSERFSFSNIQIFPHLTDLYKQITDIVDIKPANMEELTEVITAAEFHPHHCNVFVYSSSKGTIRLCDMRSSALCDRHSKCKWLLGFIYCCQKYICMLSIWYHSVEEKQ